MVGAEGEQLGIVTLADALAMAEAAELDLVEIAPTAKPPVCRIMDYGKFKYREAKKQHEAKLKQKQIQVKEVKFRPGTDEGDYKIKLRNLIRFLEEGDKAKVTLRFRGREMAHQEFGVRLLERVRNDLEPYSVVEQFPRLEGRQMVMVLAPKKTCRCSRSLEASPLTKPEAGKPAKASRSLSRREGRGEHRRGQQIEGEWHHAEDEDQDGRQEALPRARQRLDQALAGVQAPHPHQEDHQEQAPAARHRPESTRPTWTRCAPCCRTRKERDHAKSQTWCNRARAPQEGPRRRPRVSAAAATTSSASPRKR